jgi:hypothetical protein
MYRGGLKKWVPIKRSLSFAPKFAVMSLMGMPEVFVVTMQSGRTTFSTLANSSCLIFRFSITTSMIQSTPASQSRLSSKLPTFIIEAFFLVKNPAGLDFKTPANPFVANRFRQAGLFSVNPCALSASVSSKGMISRRTHSIPALVRCAAMVAPMTPAPRTAAFLISYAIIFLLLLICERVAHLCPQIQSAPSTPVCL